MVIDYSTPTGKIRMRLGDISSLPFLPDSIYASVYEESGNNLQKAVVTCGSMILAQLSYKTHKKMAQLEVYGSEAFKQMKEFLILTVKDPSFMDISPIPYSASGTTVHPLQQFQADWNKNYYKGTQSQELAFDASISPNDGSTYGPLGSGSTGWNVFNP